MFGDFYKGKKFYKGGLLWHPSGPLSPGEALPTGHLALTPPLVVATVAPDTVVIVRLQNSAPSA